MRRIRRHLTYANVISTVCLFLLLGGGAYAAFHLPPNSVKSRQIKNGQVKVADTNNALGFKCPAPTRYFEGACIKRRAHAGTATFLDANAACVDAGLRLPSVSELEGFRLEPRVQLAGFEWTSDFANADGTDIKATVVADNDTDFAATSQLHPYRCVARAKR